MMFSDRPEAAAQARFMILPDPAIVRARIAEAVSAFTASPADDPCLRRLPSSPRRGARSETWRCRSPSSSPAGCARRRRSSRRTSPAPLGTIDGFSRIEAAERLRQPLSRSAGLLDALAGRGAAPTRVAEGKAIVEHTAINPNKAAHIGHLRNAALGDAFGRLLRFLGRDVEIQNYIDDTGVQVADVALGFRELEHKRSPRSARSPMPTRFDYYCWDLYARVTEWYEDDKERLNIRAAALHDIEHGGNDTAALARFIADRIVRAPSRRRWRG